MGILVGIIAFISILPIAFSWALVTDNMRPTENYPDGCSSSTIYGDFCQTDNASLTIFRESTITSAGSTSISATLNLSYATTDLNVSNQNPPAYTGASETDIIYRAAPLGGSFTGYTWCDNAVSVTACDQQYVQFDNGSPDRALACHETGHGVGLTHGPDAWPALSDTDARLGCLRRPVVAANSLLGQNNVDNINSTY